MSDWIPTDEQLDRIRRGVERRIDRRRRVAHRVVGASVAVVVVAGGFALVVPQLGGNRGAGLTAGSAAGSSGDFRRAAANGAPEEVVCHLPDGGTRTTAPAGGGSEAAITACSRLIGSAVQPLDRGPSPTPSPAVCIDGEGRRDVYLAGGACTTHGMRQAP